MAGKLATTLFESGPNDSLVTADVYTANASVKNVTNGQASSILSSAEGSFRSNQMSPLTINGIVAKATSPISQADLSSRLAQIAGGNKSAFTSLATDVQKGALADLTSSMGINQQNVLATVNGTETMIKSADYKSATGIVGILNTITGDSKLASLFDAGSEFSLLKSICIAAIAIGIPAIIDAALKHLKDEKKKKELLLASVRQAAISTDMDSLEKIYGYVGAAGILAREPTVLTLLLANYKFPTNTTADLYPAMSTRLINFMNNINANWDRFTRNGVSVSSIALLSAATDAAITLVQLQPAFKTEALIAKSYPTVPLLTSLKSKYPKVNYEAHG